MEIRQEPRVDMRLDVKLVMWIVTALFALTMSLGGLAWAGMAGRVDRLEGIEGARIERIATLEEQVRSVRTQLDRMERTLDRLVTSTSPGPTR
jgi:hypothetical protein